LGKFFGTGSKVLSKAAAPLTIAMTMAENMDELKETGAVDPLRQAMKAGSGLGKVFSTDQPFFSMSRLEGAGEAISGATGAVYGVGTQIGKAINDAIPDDVSDQIIDGIAGLFGGETNADRAKKAKELEEKQSKEWEERKKMREAEKKRLEEEQKRADEQKKADEEKKKSEDKIAAEEEKKRKEEWDILKEGQMTASSANTAGAISDTTGVNVANTADVGGLKPISSPLPRVGMDDPNDPRPEQKNFSNVQDFIKEQNAWETRHPFIKPEATPSPDINAVKTNVKPSLTPTPVTAGTSPNIIEATTKAETSVMINQPKDKPVPVVMTDEKGVPLVNSVDRKEQANRLGGSTAAPGAAAPGAAAPTPGAAPATEGATRVPVEPGKMDYTRSTSTRTLSGDLEGLGLTPERMSALAKEMGFDISPEEAKNAPDKVLAKLGGSISSLMHQSEAKGTPGGVPRTAYNPDRRSPVGRSGSETKRTNTQFGGQPSAIEQAQTQAAVQDVVAQAMTPASPPAVTPSAPGATTPSLGQVAQGTAAGVSGMLATQGVPGAAPIAPSAAPTTPLGDRAVAMKTTGAAVDLSGFRKFNKEEKESFSNLNTEFAGRVSDLAKRYKEATGNELGLGESGGGSKDSLYRSVETQQKLKEQYGANAATAGYSAHGLGLAADLDQKAMEWAANTKDPTTGKSILESVGLARVAPNKKTGGVEKWHVTPQELGAEMGKNQKLLAIQNQFAGKGNGKLTGDEVLQQAGVQLNTISSAGKALAAQGQAGAAPTPSLGQVAQGVAVGVPAMLASQGVPGAAAVSGAISNVQQGGKTFAGNVESAIKSAADATGVPLSYMRTMAQIESSGDPTAHRTNSKYTGLYQFDEATAASVGVKDRNDAGQAALGAAKLAQKNIKSLKGYGIDVDINKNPELAYLAHQQGAKGAADIIKAAQTGGPVSDRLRKTMDANGGKGMNAAQFLEHWKKTYDKKAGQVGHKPGEADTAAPTTQTPTAPSVTAAPTTPTAPAVATAAPAPTRVPVASGQMDRRRSTSIRNIDSSLADLGLTPEMVASASQAMGLGNRSADELLTIGGQQVSALLHQSEAKGTPGGVPRTAYNPDRRAPVGRSGRETIRTNTQFGGQSTVNEQSQIVPNPITQNTVSGMTPPPADISTQAPPDIAALGPRAAQNYNLLNMPNVQASLDALKSGGANILSSAGGFARNFNEATGNALRGTGIPKAIGSALNSGMSAVDSIRQSGGLGSMMSGDISGLVDRVAPELSSAISGVQGVFNQSLSGAGGFARNFNEAAGNALRGTGIPKAIGSALNSSGGIGNAVGGALSSVGGALGSMGSAAGDALSSLTSGLPSLSSMGTGMMSGALESAGLNDKVNEMRASADTQNAVSAQNSGKRSGETRVNPERGSSIMEGQSTGPIEVRNPESSIRRLTDMLIAYTFRLKINDLCNYVF